MSIGPPAWISPAKGRDGLPAATPLYCDVCGAVVGLRAVTTYDPPEGLVEEAGYLDDIAHFEQGGGAHTKYGCLPLYTEALVCSDSCEERLRRLVENASPSFPWRKIPDDVKAAWAKLDRAAQREKRARDKAEKLRLEDERRRVEAPLEPGQIRLGHGDRLMRVVEVVETTATVEPVKPSHGLGRVTLSRDFVQSWPLAPKPPKPEKRR